MLALVASQLTFTGILQKAWALCHGAKQRYPDLVLEKMKSNPGENGKIASMAAVPYNKINQQLNNNLCEPQNAFCFTPFSKYPK